MRVNAFVSMMIAAALAAASSMAMAQNATPPNPQDIEPRVNTSATPPARETPRPEDVEPRVNTSAPTDSSSSPSSPSSPARDGRANEAATGVSSGAAGNAAASAKPSQRTPATASGAPASGATGTTGGASNTTAAAQGTAAAKPGAAKGKSLDRLELDTTQITGNRELPKVLYIVPWKRSDLGDLVGRPVNSLLDEVLTPVDRDVFQRENRYYRALTPGAAENDALSADDGRARGPQRDPVRTNSAPAAGSQGSATHPRGCSSAHRPGYSPANPPTRPGYWSSRADRPRHETPGWRSGRRARGDSP